MIFENNPLDTGAAVDEKSPPLGTTDSALFVKSPLLVDANKPFPESAAVTLFVMLAKRPVEVAGGVRSAVLPKSPLPILLATT